MKRKKQTIFFLVMILVFSVCYVRLRNIYFSPQQVFEQHLRGLGYAPVEEILLERELPDGTVYLVGKREDIFSSIITEKKGFFWKYKSGMSGYQISEEEKFKGYIEGNGFYLGHCTDPEITEIYLLAGNYADWRFFEYTIPVDEDGFFFWETGLDIDNQQDIYVEGRNASGEAVVKKGEEGIARQVWEGITAAERPQLTKPFVTAP